MDNKLEEKFKANYGSLKEAKQALLMRNVCIAIFVLTEAFILVLAFFVFKSYSGWGVFGFTVIVCIATGYYIYDAESIRRDIEEFETASNEDRDPLNLRKHLEE